MFQLKPSRYVRGFLVNVLLITALILSVSQSISKADEVPAFFLKIAKNIPRVGRSGSFEDFLTKYPKSLVGRREEDDESAQNWPSRNSGSPFVGPAKRRMDYQPINTAADAWAWQHFPLAIEGPRELWRTLAGYSTDTSDEIDNEIWERQKRTGLSAANL